MHKCVIARERVNEVDCKWNSSEPDILHPDSLSIYLNSDPQQLYHDDCYYGSLLTYSHQECQQVCTIVCLRQL